MSLRDISFSGDTPLCLIQSANVKANRSYGLDTKTCQKLYKHDIEVKGQRRIGIMSAHNTSSRDDTIMCKLYMYMYIHICYTL